MAFTAKDVAALREKTGCGMMDCKKALTESDGNMDAAIDFLREKGLAAASKKSGRIAAEGIVSAYNDGSVAVVIEVNAETDFVAKNADFQNFVAALAKTVAVKNPADVATLLNEKMVDSNQTTEEALREKILTIGENIKIRRFVREEGVVATYIHGGGRIGVMVKFTGAETVKDNDTFKTLGQDIAMQIAAISPQFVRKEDVSAEILEKEKKILMEQVKGEGKPANIAEKIVAGKIGKYYSENCLLEQGYVKDDSMTVAKHIANVSAELSVTLGIESILRFEKGEGLEKREDNFADEVASMMNK